MSAAPSDRPPICLLDSELEELTGSPFPKLQLEWLTREGWVYVLNRRGRPRVARAYFEQRMGVGQAANDGGAAGPDWSGFAKG